MKRTLCVAVMAAVSLHAMPAAGQEAEPAAADGQVSALDDFDYLLGDWEFTSESRDFGRGHGLWSAVRLSEGHVLDEYRIIGDEGETFWVVTTIRSYDADADRWDLIGMADGNGLRDVGTARRVGSEIHLEQHFGAGTDRPELWRIRYHDIRPDRFSWTADRTRDGGSTWELGHMTIEARRIGPARSLGPLTPRWQQRDPAASGADDARRESVLGLGGFFFRARDHGALARWYEEQLGVTRTPTSYEMTPWIQEAGPTVFAPFPADTDYFGDAEQAFMLNFRVRDLDAMVAQLRAAGVDVDVDPERYPNGRFARAHDPEGNPIQLWEPADPQAEP